MKVLQVNCVYKKGSTGKITYDLHKGLLDSGIESVVCYGRGEVIHDQGVYKTCPELYSKLNNAWSRITGIMYGGCFFSTNRLISVIKKEEPDIVHLQCINGYFVNIYRLLNWLKKKRIKTVLTLHAEFMFTGGCGYSIDCNQWSTHKGCGYNKCPRYHSDMKSIFFDRSKLMWKKMQSAFEGFEDNLIVTSVSPWLMKRASSSRILGKMRHVVVLNGVNIDIFHPYDTRELRKKYNCENCKVVFHATAAFSTDIDHIKGGWFICELARMMPNIQFIVAGPYQENCVVPQNVKLLGQITDQFELAKYYSMADVTVITSKRETFSMVTAESLCCGTPVVGFCAGGPEQIAIEEFSKFTEYGDVEKLQIEILNCLENDKNKRISEIAEKKYSLNTMIQSYIDCYQLLGGCYEL